MIVPQKTQPAGGQSAQPIYNGRSDRLPSPGPGARLLARLRAHSLDEGLLAGFDPAGSQQLAARALALTSPRSRAALADGLERWLSAAHGATTRGRVLPPRDLAAAGESELRAIVAELRGSAPLYARGVALLGALVRDGAGPAYVGGRDALVGLLGEAHAAIAGHAGLGPPVRWRPERRPSAGPQ